MLSWRKDKKDGVPDEPQASSETGRPVPRPAAGAPSPAAPDRFAEPPRKRLGDMLYEEGHITQAQLKEAAARKDKDGTFIGKALVDLGYIDQKTLMSFLVKQCKIPHISLLDYEIKGDLLQLIPEELCLKHHMLPIDKLGRILTVAMVDPLDTVALEDVRAYCPELKVKPILCNWDHFVTVAQRLFKKGLAAQHELTAESLGLSSGKPAPKAPSKTAPPPADAAGEAAVDAAVEDLLKEVQAPQPRVKPDKETGATDAAPAAKAPVKAAAAPVAEAPKAASREIATAQAVPVREPAPAVAMEDLAARMQQVMQGAMADLATQLRESAPREVSGAPAAHELAALMNQNLQTALRDTLGPFLEDIRKTAAEGKAQQGLSAQELGAAIGNSVKEAVQGTIGSIAEELHVLVAEREPAVTPPTPQDLAANLQEGIRGAMQEAVACIVSETRRSVNTHAAQPQPSIDGLADSIRDSVRDAMKDVVGALTQHTRDIVQATRTEAPGPSAESMAEVLRTTVQDAMKNMTVVLAEQAQQAGSKQPSAEELSQVLRSSVQDAVKDMTAALAAHAQRLSPAGPASPSPEEMAAAIRSSVQDAMKDMATALSEHTRQLSALADAGDDGPTPEELAEVLGSSVRDAMQEAVKSLSATRTDESPLREALVRQAQEAAQTAEEFRSAIDAMREALMVQKESQAAREEKLTELLEQVVRANLAKAEAPAPAPAPPAPAEPQTVPFRRPNPESGKYSSVTLLRPQAAETVEAIDALHNSQALGGTDERVRAAMESENPLDILTFDNYFVGKPNAFTFALAKAVAESPGKEYNPFFLYGEVGTGKTHLINAIANHVQRVDRDTRVGYVSAGRFARRLMEAAQDNELDAFREAYCRCDLLVFDDVQFLAGHDEVQEEFFHIFNALQLANRQIILAADKAPDKLGQLEKRLVSRFSGGIVANLAPPDWDTRLRILRQQAKDAAVIVSDDILALIATRVPQDIRKMTGCLRKVLAFAKLVDRELTCDLASEILTHLGVVDAA